MIEIASLAPLSESPPAGSVAPAAASQPSRVAETFATVFGGAAPSPTAAVQPEAGLGERFEAAVLTPLVTAILPPEDSSVWGGQAGKLWRGLFAEELSAATAASGGVGIADLIDDAVASRYQTAQEDRG